MNYEPLAFQVYDAYKYWEKPAMEKITDAQIKKALELHSVQGRILRLLAKFDVPEERHRVLVAAALLSGVTISKLGDWTLNKKETK